MGESERQRQAILMRRAVFLSTAMAAVGCSSTKETSPAIPADSRGPRTNQPRKKKPPPAPAGAWEEVMRAAPPTQIPDGVSARERAQLQSVVTGFEFKYATVRAVWTATPGCDPSAASCPDWKKVATDARKMYAALDGFSVGSCGGANGETASVTERERAHRAYVGSLVVRLEAHLQKLALTHGPSGTDAWAKMLKKAQEPPPRPCLGPCPAAGLSDILVSVGFGKDDSALGSAVMARLESVLATAKAQGSRATLVVRGHADPSEPNPSKLGDARAKATVKWLIEKGVPAATLTATSLGATLLVERSGGPSGGAANRRVDFLVVPR